ncbi:transposase [Thioalkalicoccus limnaeus]|uniref:Transposase n=1 Tax=Thioalkalicoccus limnaeus TaxID=120681 RepID=A0ABV4BDV5_9GAMM
MPVCERLDHKRKCNASRDARQLRLLHNASVQRRRAAPSAVTDCSSYPKDWVVNCKAVGTGEKALVYLGRYLYRGVIREKDIVSCENGQVTFRYRHAKDKRWAYRTLPGAEFLALVLQHVLPKGFRRTRNFGFLHPNSQRAIRLLQWLFGLDPKRLPISRPRPGLLCPTCGTPMIIVQTRLPPRAGPPPTATEALAM